MFDEHDKRKRDDEEENDVDEALGQMDEGSEADALTDESPEEGDDASEADDEQV